eukprot:2543893-Rhodomonas_salina.3
MRTECSGNEGPRTGNRGMSMSLVTPCGVLEHGEVAERTEERRRVVELELRRLHHAQQELRVILRLGTCIQLCGVLRSVGGVLRCFGGVSCLAPRDAVLGPFWSSPLPHLHRREGRERPSFDRGVDSHLGGDLRFGTERPCDVRPYAAVPYVSDSPLLDGEFEAHLARQLGAWDEGSLHVALGAAGEDSVDLVEGKGCSAAAASLWGGDGDDDNEEVEEEE